MCNLYGIFDKKANAYCFYFTSVGDNTLLRDVVRILEKAQGSDFVKFPNDFAIYRLCQINDETGRVYPESMPEMMSELVSYFVSNEANKEQEEADRHQQWLKEKEGEKE